MRTILTSCMIALGAACSSSVNDDPFIGTFESDAQDIAGFGAPGDWRVEVVYLSTNGKYEATVYRKGVQFEKHYLIYCSEDKEDLLWRRPPGNLEVLCVDDGSKFVRGFLSYAKNGIYFGARYSSAKYYAHTQLGYHSFRKVAP